MKVTDYAPRAAPFDTYLRGRELVGVEIGVDVGAHAEALLTYCPVAFLHLVDPWPNLERKGYCDGRLARWRGRYEQHRMKSLEAAKILRERHKNCAWSIDGFDFVYIDQEHDGSTTATDLDAWWPLVKSGGVIGLRNYVEGRGSPHDTAIERFAAKQTAQMRYERYLNDAILAKP